MIPEENVIVTPAIEAVVKETSIHPEKLSEEEEKKRLLFIGGCVDRNIQYPSNTKFGSMLPLTVQDISNAGVSTLQKIGTQLKKAASDVDPEFSDSTEGLKIEGIKAEDWIEFFKLTIKKKKHREFVRTTNKKRRDLKVSIAAAKTPQELREEAEKELAALGEEEID